MSISWGHTLRVQTLTGPTGFDLLMPWIPILHPDVMFGRVIGVDLILQNYMIYPILVSSKSL
jgi:hypothetical protein